jgi:hypothetical protein
VAQRNDNDRQTKTPRPKAVGSRLLPQPQALLLRVAAAAARHGACRPACCGRHGPELAGP